MGEVEDNLAEALESRRKEPLYGPPEGLAGHFVSTARLILRQAAMKPVEGKAKIFIIGYAERLVPQESSPEAANALLKLLEEPPEGAFFMLTTSDADAVLPTIRSRAIELRLGPLADGDVRGFLSAHAGLSEKDVERQVARAGGAIGTVFGEDDDAAKGRQMATVLLESARTRSQVQWEMAIKQTPFSARGEFTSTLDAMSEMLSQAARESGTSGRLSQLSAVPAPRLALALERLGEAREMAQNNVNPQVLLAVLAQDLGELL